MCCTTAILQQCSTFFFWIFPLTLIPYPGFNFIPLFWTADIVGSTDGDVWDEVAPSPTHLSQHIVHIFYEVNNVNAFVFKRKKLMESMNDGIDEGEGASDSSFVGREGEQEGSQESDEGPQDNEKGHDPSDREQGSDEKIKSSSDGEDNSEHAHSTSATNSDDDSFDAARGITFFHLFFFSMVVDIFWDRVLTSSS